MAGRANWKGFLKCGELSCAVGLYTAASTSERIAFHMLNRQTGNRLNREFVDSDTDKLVAREDQVKGYEVRDGEDIILEPDEVAATVPDSDKLLEIGDFVAEAEIDDVYLDKPYYLAPSDSQSREVFILIRDALAEGKVAAIARTVLFRRVRTLLIRAHDKGLVASTLNFDYEVRPAKDAFAGMPRLDIKGEMLDLASHIIETKRGKFDPAAFDDRYEAALAELVKAKLEGRKIEKRPEPKSDNVVDLMEALRESAGKSAPRTEATNKAKSKKATAKGKQTGSGTKAKPAARRSSRAG